MLRGNHECASLTRIYGFYDECRKRFSVKLWKNFVEVRAIPVSLKPVHSASVSVSWQVFNVLPLAALIDGKIFCVHGGLSPDLKNIGDILKLERPQHVPEEVLSCIPARIL